MVTGIPTQLILFRGIGKKYDDENNDKTRYIKSYRKREKRDGLNKEMKQEQLQERTFDEKKTAYFSELALGVLSAMRLHKKPGLLWERNKKGQRDWGNISEHCLTELARLKVLAGKLRLSEEAERNGELGAALHDFDKRSEILAMKGAIQRGESGREASIAADEEGERQLREAGFSNEVVVLAGCTGGKPPQLFEIARILGKENLTDHEIALLVLHYIDGYTLDDKWAESAMRAEDGSILNDVDRRMQKNLENPTYRKQAEELAYAYDENPLLRGRGPHENEAMVCHEIEKKLAEIIASRTGEKIDPLELPEIVDLEIKKKIEETEI